MSSEIYSQSFNSRAKRYAMTAQVKYNPLMPSNHASIPGAIWSTRRTVPAQGTLSLGQANTFQLPLTGYLQNLFLKVTFAQTGTASMSDYPGAALIDRVRLLSSGQTLVEYNYADVFQFYLNHLDRDSSDDILKSAGDTGANNPTTSGQVTAVVPIFTPFDYLLTESVQALNLGKIQEALTLELTFRSDSNLGKSGATGIAIQSGNLIVNTFSTTSEMDRILRPIKGGKEMDYVYNTIEFQTKSKQTLNTGVETDIDISSFNGNVKKLFVTLNDNADVTTNNEYFVLKEVSSLKYRVDGVESITFESKEEARLRHVYVSKGKHSNVLGEGYQVDFGFPYMDKEIDFSGGISNSVYNKLELEVQQDEVAVGALNILAIKNVQYVHRNGALIRVN